VNPPRSPAPTNRLLWFAVAAIAALRLATLGLYPLMDTTEARYAEIARKLVELGDWGALWFNYGEPFWGKPPLSFWMTGAGFKALGVSEFAARFPHWLGGGLVAWLLWNWLARRSLHEAIFALALLCGSLGYFVAAGAVITDMALVLGTTLAMRGFWLALHGAPTERRREQYLFFLGAAAGLLAKGPVAAVLIGVPVAVWTLSCGESQRVLREISWGYGLLLTMALVVPWYSWAEWRTPGFLEYFLIGENWHRFSTPGWSGDLYGSAHAEPRGSIWLFAIAACLPWSILMPILAWRWKRVANPVEAADRKLYGYLLLWGLFPCVIFSFAGNILWTYVLPGVPALAMLTALWLARLPRSLPVERLVAGGMAFTALVILLAVAVLRFGGLGDEKSARALVAAYYSHRSVGESLVFLGKRTFSASFYSQGRAESVCCVDELRARLDRGPVFVAIRDDDIDELPATMMSQLRPVGRRGNYELFQSGPHAGGR